MVSASCTIILGAICILGVTEGNPFGYPGGCPGGCGGYQIGFGGPGGIPPGVPPFLPPPIPPYGWRDDDSLDKILPWLILLLAN
ncbi:unnamed protein product [Arctia plantaginis]|uniref:Uncharacterized protein n=1 Tax=Arctia plantaginis TaxID=874455 RepID=A0A8S1A953_ARCPL|nr:unnamed protein product [Arctia plantaginis]